jgi:hypothetical protein
MPNQTQAAISKMKEVADAIALTNILKSIHSKVLHNPFKIFTACSPEALKDKSMEFENIHYEAEQSLTKAINEQIGWITGSQVCYCAEAFQGVPREHPDAPALSVLATVLRNG